MIDGRKVVAVMVSIRRADYWLVEDHGAEFLPKLLIGFNPPGGLLVG